MSIMIVLLIILIPPVMGICSWLFEIGRHVFAGAAVLSAYIVGIVISLAIHDILRDDTVFMTNIHVVFTNTLFLFCGAYLGAYGIYVLLLHFLKGLRKE
ncbi:transposase [Paenibacillus roseipurpureus]|uniref:Transposase n=1 Tax=Paenibacillus roseopurpureus TaxID=2918901 RepID=A0AA96LPA6_9BACL|nr:transposase [Paenibacillus sp. MBLB1832]WNR45737.1 transposase [Paenibacillus sp. MBLB1832]